MQSYLMQRKTMNIVVTGGNSGIGYETMKELYSRGHNVIFGSRNEARNQEAVMGIRK
jgi:NAD(P)-dependent dehydrogenase (short-subunit alcohol dehydrogenase family)